MFARLGPWCHDRRKVVLFVWIAALVVFNVIASGVGDAYRQDFTLKGFESTEGFDLLEAEFPDGPASPQFGTIVFQAEEDVRDPAVREPMEALFAEVRQLEHVTLVQSPYDPGGERQISTQGDAPGTIAVANVYLPEDIDFTAAADVANEIEALLPVEGVRVELGGYLFAEFEEPSSELFGLAFAIVILIVAFGSVLAMGLPVAVALFGIGIGSAFVVLASHVIQVPDFAPFIGIMIGLGVGIDYALLIVTRYREQLHAGHEIRESIGIAIDTAGRSVVFAGATVVISLLGMLLMGVGFVGGLGITAAVTVAVTVLASVTLLPALLGFAGSRIERTRWRGLTAAGFVALGLVGLGLGVSALAGIGFALALITIVLGFFVPALKREVPHRPPRPRRETIAYRWSRLIQHRPWPFAIGATALLLVLAIPFLSLRLGFQDESNFADDTDHQAGVRPPGRGVRQGVQRPTAARERRVRRDRHQRAGGGDRRHRGRRRGCIGRRPRAERRAEPVGGALERRARQRPARRSDHVVGQPVAQRRAPAAGGSDRDGGARHWVRRRQCRLLDVARRASPSLLHCCVGALVPAVDGRVPVAPRPAQGGDHEPAVDRRCVRSDRRVVPVGLAQRHHRGGARTDRGMGADDAVRSRVRTVDGLRSLPAFTRAGRSGIAQATAAPRWPTASPRRRR